VATERTGEIGTHTVEKAGNFPVGELDALDVGGAAQRRMEIVDGQTQGPAVIQLVGTSYFRSNY
jgi:hypothetical protein